MEKEMSESTKWLVSPVTERVRRLRSEGVLEVKPYYGRSRKLRLIRTEILIGSDPSCDIRLDDPFVSPRHARVHLAADGSGYFVHDLDSRNGVFLNGIRVLGAPLPATGSLRLGRSAIVWGAQSAVEGALGGPGWVVADPAMVAVVEALRSAAASRLPVLLLGETGTGKDVLARFIHQHGAGGGAPYVPLNCALAGGPLAESELFGHCKGAFTGAENPRLGALRSAHGGTLFLDELADMPASAQVQLLRALESGEVKALGADRLERSDFRLVSATSRDIEARIADGSFRLDLYFRVAGHVIRVPPLRERPKDILAIAQVALADRGMELDAEALMRLQAYSWPGNVRELRSCLERAISSASAEGSSRVLPTHLAGMDRSGLFAKAAKQDEMPRTLHQAERECVEAALSRSGWSRTVAAKELGISRSGLWEKMRRHGLSAQVIK